MVKERVALDRLPDLFRENLIIFFSLSNYLKRFYIWNVKKGQVEQALHVCETLEPMIGSIYMDVDKLEDEIYSCRNGGIIYNSESGKNEEVGLFRATEKFCDELNNSAILIQKIYGWYYQRVHKVGTKEYENFIQEIQRQNSKLAKAKEILKNSNTLLNDRAKAYGNHMVLKAWRYLILDQCNPYGATAHEYKFVDPGTRLSDGSIVKGHKLEVNQYFEVLEDIYEGKSKRCILMRLLPVKCICWSLLTA